MKFLCVDGICENANCIKPRGASAYPFEVQCQKLVAAKAGADLVVAHKLAIAVEALRFYGQKPQPDITSEFSKSAAEFGQGVCTWEPLTDLGSRAREALAKIEGAK